MHVSETITLTYTAVVRNIDSNQNGVTCLTILPN